MKKENARINLRQHPQTVADVYKSMNLKKENDAIFASKNIVKKAIYELFV